MEKPEQTNFITKKMVQRALDVHDGILKINEEIIGHRNPRELDKLMSSLQKSYDRGLNLHKIVEKLTQFFNWKIGEYFPKEECKEKYLFLKATIIRSTRGEKCKQLLSYVESMLSTQFNEK